MARDENSEASKLWDTVVWVLRITIALQCLGNWHWLANLEASPLLSWLINPIDVGGLNWNEGTGELVQQVVGWLALVAGVFVLWRPCAPVLSPLVLLQVLIAVALWRTDSGFSLQKPWLSPDLAALFPFFTEAARIAAPLGLLLLDPWLVKRPLSERRVGVATGLMCWAIALTFLAHGVEAWQLHPPFIDLLIGTFSRLLGVKLPQSTAEQFLTIVAVLDVLVAVLCVAFRLRSILWWMALWGGVTACSRMTAYGVDRMWHETLTRAPHVGLPLAIVLIWYLLPWKTDEPSPGPEASGPE